MLADDGSRFFVACLIERFERGAQRLLAGADGDAGQIGPAADGRRDQQQDRPGDGEAALALPPVQARSSADEDEQPPRTIAISRSALSG